MIDENNSILIIGESGVGKTHYGAQVLMRLQQNSGQISMDGAASNLEPFAEATDRLNEGLAADHTPTTTYVESIWPIRDTNGSKGQLVWPDYGGEQISNIPSSRTIPVDWHRRVIESSSWVFMLRPSQYRLTEDVLSKPYSAKEIVSEDISSKAKISDQSRLIELLQILLYLHKSSGINRNTRPKVCFLLCCWDELSTKLKPFELLNNQLPMLFDFIHSNWDTPLIMGLSSLGMSLDKKSENNEYVNNGPEQYGFVVLPDGQKSKDITLPITYLID